MSALPVTLGFISLVFRFLAFVFLRYLPGIPIAFLALAFGVIYFVGWYRFDCLLQSYKKYWSQKTSGSTSKDSDSNRPPSTPPPTQLVDYDGEDDPVIGTVSVLSGFPTYSRILNVVTLLINVLLFLACVHCQLYHSVLGYNTDVTFVRVGAVGDTWVKLFARIPPSEDSPSVSTRTQVHYRLAKPVGKWVRGPEFTPSNTSDWTSAVTLSSLYPLTEYEYKLTETSASFQSLHHPKFPTTFKFKTFPDYRLSQSNTLFTFAASSCIKPGFPFSPFQSPLTIPGARNLANTVSQKGIDFVIFMGDFIYADVPNPFQRFTLSKYLRFYRQVYASKDWRAIYEQTPIFHIYDDHDIINDYSRGQTNHTEPFIAAEKAYNMYHGVANYETPGLGLNYYWWRNGDAAFFTMDTRKHRSPNSASDVTGKTMLGEKQKTDFLNWVSAVNNTATFKFVISSVPFASLWVSDNPTFNFAVDTWAGFLAERDELMDVLQYVPNVIFLSGDRHEFLAAQIRESTLEFSTGPLNMFYSPIKTVKPTNGRGKTGEDVILHYRNPGQNKYSTFEVDTRDLEKPMVKTILYVDGEEAWKLDVIGKKVVKPPSTGIGSLSLGLGEILGLGKGWF